ncbi:MAG TPA: CheR family methyltransferase [Labilithrix sp.]|nr:CheR family methyltransferase [Labilithrix sp.]
MPSSPRHGKELAFEREGERVRLRERFRRSVTFIRQDIRRDMPDGPHDAILCRNVAFTYFDDATQRCFLERAVERLVPGGILVLGAHEKLPTEIDTVEPSAPLFYVRR